MPKIYTNKNVQAFAALEEAADKFGGRNKFALKLIDRGVKVTASSVANWKKVPMKYARVVSEVSGIPHTELLPEIDWL